MDDYVETNRRHWEEASTFHPETDAYDVEGFLDGETTLTPIEREEVGDVDGVDLCHLQFDLLPPLKGGIPPRG